MWKSCEYGSGSCLVLIFLFGLVFCLLFFLVYSNQWFVYRFFFFLNLGLKFLNWKIIIILKTKDDLIWFIHTQGRFLSCLQQFPYFGHSLNMLTCELIGFHVVSDFYCSTVQWNLKSYIHIDYPKGGCYIFLFL